MSCTLVSRISGFWREFVIILALVCLGLLVKFLRSGIMLSLTAELNPADLVRRDFGINIPTTLPIPTSDTSLPTSIVSDIVSVGQSIASEVTSALAQVTQAPTLQLSFNVSKAEIDITGFSQDAFHRSNSSLSGVVGFSLVLQACTVLSAVLGIIAKILRWTFWTTVADILVTGFVVLSIVPLVALLLIGLLVKDSMHDLVNNNITSTVYEQWDVTWPTIMLLLVILQFASSLLRSLERPTSSPTSTSSVPPPTAKPARYHPDRSYQPAERKV